MKRNRIFRGKYSVPKVGKIELGRHKGMTFTIKNSLPRKNTDGSVLEA
jgi:hypothetical protein